MIKSLYEIPLTIVFLFLLTNEKVHCQNRLKIEQLPAAINTDFEEIKAFSTTNGDSLFFIRSYSQDNTGGESSGEDIWLSTFTEKQGWTTATNKFGYNNSQGPDIFAGLSKDGTSLFTISYAQHKQSRTLEISAHKLRNHQTSASSAKINTQITIGYEYHDLYINPEGNILLISMESLNSLGQEDIYVSLKNENNIWSSPTNLGSSINSRGFEISPFLSANKKVLYFASDGHGGFGDADIFQSERLDEGWQNWSQPKNMGPPINSPKFDAYLFINQKKEIFISSNRSGRYSDIYKITEEIKGASTSIKDQISMHNLVESDEDLKDFAIPISLSIYFDIDQHKVSGTELLKLNALAAKAINDTDVFFDVIGYTDNSGSESYNMKLSKKRAQFVYHYLIKAGLDKDRLSMQGKGIFVAPDNQEVPSAQMRKVHIVAKKEN